MAGNCHKLAVEDWFAVTPAVPADVKRVVFVHGKTFHDGGWFDASATTVNPFHLHQPSNTTDRL